MARWRATSSFAPAAPQDSTATPPSPEENLYEQYRIKIDEADSRATLGAVGNTISMLAAQGKITSQRRADLLKQYQAKYAQLTPPKADDSGGAIS